MAKNKDKIYDEYYKELPLEAINIIDHRRFKKETVASLEESIKYNGLINPITVEETYDGKYNLIAGYHRLKAFKSLSFDDKKFCIIPCKIRKFNIEISDKERNLLKNIAKQEENYIRQTFTPAEMAQDYLELEDCYKKRFPGYEEDPVRYIEKYHEHEERKKRAENELKIANNKADKHLLLMKLERIQRDLQRFRPPSENIKHLFPEATKTDIDSAEKIAECEKNNFGLIKTLLDDNVCKTVINRITPKLIEEENVQEYLDCNKEERKQFISKLSNEIKIDKMKLDIEQIYEDVYQIGKIKKHCIVMDEQKYLVVEKQYNVVIRVENNNMVPSILSSFNLEFFKVLVIFYDKKFFDNFVESFK